MRAVTPVLGAALLGLLPWTASPAAGETATTRVAELSGSDTRVRRADPDGRATTSLELYRDSGRVCWTIRFERYSLRHLAVYRDGTGAEALELYDEAPSDGPTLSGCDDAAPALAAELADQPQRFFVRASDYSGNEIAGTLSGSGPAPTPSVRSIERACPPGSVPEDGFRDVPADNGHEAAVDCIVWWRVAGGRTADTYEPAASATRGQLATYVAQVIVESGGSLPLVTRDWFSDDNGSPHEANINRLREAGIVSGGADGRYGVDRPVSRGAMATFLAGAYAHRTGQQLQASADHFSDDNGSTHEANTNRVAEAGLTGGTSAGRFSPDAPVRRDQMGSFLARLLDLHVEQGRAQPPSNR